MITSSGRGSGSGSADASFYRAEAPVCELHPGDRVVYMTVALSSFWSATSGIDRSLWRADRGSVDWKKLAILLGRIEGYLRRS